MVNYNIIREALAAFLDENQILTDVSMQRHTTFKVGGTADLMVLPATEEQVAKVARTLREQAVPYMIIGKGSNLLVRDGGYRGVIIKLADNFSAMQVEDCYITAQAGVTLAALVHTAHQNGLCGMEYAGGIPGTVGGAVSMNAGAYGGEIKDNAISVHILDEHLNIREISNADMQFGYRKSMLTGTSAIALQAKFRLVRGDVDAARDLLNCLNQKRREKQPLQYPSAGSTFKRPEGNFAGTLIEKAGLKGFRVGGAAVSTLHAGFVVNTGDATAADIINVIKAVQKRVYESSGIMLEPEIKIIGED